jgi:S1-C subfamily serine protease
LLIQSAGSLTGVIEPGDILVEAEGQPLGSFEQLLVTVRQAYERRATRLSGRLYRKGDLLPVTVEPGW